MKTLGLLVLFLTIRQLSAECVKVSQNEMLCSNEFSFEHFEPTVTTLKLFNSFIARSRLEQVFPDLKTVHARGIFLAAQCAQFSSHQYAVYGCDGKCRASCRNDLHIFLAW